MEHMKKVLGKLAAKEADALRHRLSRRAKKESSMEPFEEEIKNQSSHTEELYASKDLQERLRKLIEDLPGENATPLLLHYFDGLTHEEIAEVLEIPRSTISYRLKKGLELLAPKVRKLGIDDLSKALGVIAAGAMLLKAPAHVSAASLWSTSLQAGTTASSGIAVSQLLSIKGAAVFLSALVIVVTIGALTLRKDPYPPANTTESKESSTTANVERKMAKEPDLPEPKKAVYNGLSEENAASEVEDLSSSDETDSDRPVKVRGTVKDAEGNELTDYTVTVKYLHIKDRSGAGVSRGELQSVVRLDNRMTNIGFHTNANAMFESVEIEEGGTFTFSESNYSLDTKLEAVTRLIINKEGYAPASEMIFQISHFQEEENVSFFNHAFNIDAVLKDESFLDVNVRSITGSTLPDSTISYRQLDSMGVSESRFLPKTSWSHNSGNHHGSLSIAYDASSRIQVVVNAPGFEREVKTVEETITSLSFDLEPSGHRVEGTLTYFNTESPVGSETILLFQKNIDDFDLDALPIKAKTDLSGRFVFQNIAEGEYRAHIKSLDKRIYQEPGHWGVDFVVDQDIDLSLQAFEGFTVRGTVKDRATGEPVENAIVRVPYSRFALAEPVEDYTTERGLFFLSPVFGKITRSEPGDQGMQQPVSLNLTIDHGNYISWEFEGTPIKLDMLDPEITATVHMFTPFQVSGRIVDPLGKPEKDVLVAWNTIPRRSISAKHFTRTDETGQFTLDVDPDTEVYIGYSKDMHSMHYSPLRNSSVLSGEDIELTLYPARVETVELEGIDFEHLEKAFKASLNVSRVFDNNYSEGSTTKETIASNETFMLTGLPSKEQPLPSFITSENYTLYISHPDYNQLIFDDVQSHIEEYGKIIGRPVKRGEGSTLSMEIYDTDGTSVDGVKVRARNRYGTKLSALTDTEGKARISDLPDGELVISASIDEVDLFTKTLDLKETSTDTMVYEIGTGFIE